MQLEFVLFDWRPMFSAPRNCDWVEIECTNRKIVTAHFADGGGEDQPRFYGWFVDAGSYFMQVEPKPKRWRPIPC